LRVRPYFEIGTGRGRAKGSGSKFQRHCTAV